MKALEKLERRDIFQEKWPGKVPSVTQPLPWIQLSPKTNKQTEKKKKTAFASLVYTTQYNYKIIISCEYLNHTFHVKSCFYHYF